MRKMILVIISTVFIWAVPSWATTIHVPGDSVRMQSAINGASDGDTVLVAPGTYREHIDFIGKAIVVISEEGPEVTILEKQFDRRPIVTFANHEDSSSYINGFKIQLSTNTGIFCNLSSATIINNIIESNIGSSYGAGLEAVNSPEPLVIKNNIFHSNYGLDGHGYKCGGMYLQGVVEATIESNIFYDNTGYDGSAFAIYGGLFNIRYNLIYNNTGTGAGAIYIKETSPNSRIENNTIVSNSAGGLSGGIFLDFCNNGLFIRNNIIVQNDFHGVYGRDSGNISYIYNCSYNNDDGDTYGFAPGQGNIYVDPLFLDPDNNDYSLQWNSPCIDSGDPSSPLDPDGTIADLGAIFYYQCLISPFNLIYPQSDQVYINAPTYFVWHQTTDIDSGYMVYYKYCIDDNPAFGAPDSSGELIDTFFVLPDTLTRSTQYFWKVLAHNYHSKPISSDETWNFYIDGYPTMPTIISPENDGQADTTTYLTWLLGTDPDTFDVVSYTVQIDEDSLFGSPEIDQAGLSTGTLLDESFSIMLGDLEDIGNLLINTIYYWRVRADDNYGLSSAWTDSLNWFYYLYQTKAYLPGDANMANGAWPPSAIGSDVTYLVNYFRLFPSCQPCLIDGVWCSADANGDCNIMGVDVTRLVSYFRGLTTVGFCPEYPPVWLTSDELPAEPPDEWPNCQE
ncbi:MAG: right-handed parallel beta-helix repeat-containing protein [candidate division Zixibacteria bacterium]|nr:right-handed parallel beta-helix repeat-containing protein [candidate division Zixibacteria bacterium]